MDYVMTLFMLSLIGQTPSAKKFNITVMVPGKKSFEGLVKTLESPSSDVVSNDYADYYPNYYEYKTPFDCLQEPINQSQADCLFQRDFITYPWSYIFVKPALEIALEKIQKTGGPLEDFEISLQYRDTADEYGKASARESQIASVDSKMNDKTVAILGVMNCFAAARVITFTSHWGMLQVTPGAHASTFKSNRNKHKEEARLLLRTGPTAEQVGDCVASIFEFYNWTRSGGYVFEDDIEERYHYFMAEGIYDRIFNKFPDGRWEDFRIDEYHDFDKRKIDYDDLMKHLKLNGRVFVVTLYPETTLDFMAAAYKYDRYADFGYVIIDLDKKLGTRPWIGSKENEEEKIDEGIKKVFERSLIVTLPEKKSRIYESFVRDITKRLGRNMENGLNEDTSTRVATLLAQYLAEEANSKDIDDYFKKNLYPEFFHDSLLAVAHILNQSLIEKEINVTNKPGMTKRIVEIPDRIDAEALKNYTKKDFEGLTGMLNFDRNGDRDFDFLVWGFNQLEDRMKLVGKYSAETKSYEESEKMVWPGGSPPKDIPECGFDDKKCPKTSLNPLDLAVIAVVAAVIVIGAIAYNVIRKQRIKKELQRQLWKVSWGDISWPPNSVLEGWIPGGAWMREGKGVSESDTFLGDIISSYIPSMSPATNAKRANKRKRKWSSNSRKERLDSERKTSSWSLISDKVYLGFTTVAFHKDKTVVLKMTNRRKVDLTRDIDMELKHMRTVTHEHLTRFEGACIESPHICILTEYCPKGSLKDILLNEDVTMDWMFRVSLMNDLVKGMNFLHDSPIHCHGNLKSTNCVIDSRFVLKVTDYGLPSIRSPRSWDGSERDCEKKLWTAPEILRSRPTCPVGSQKGDVYSFGIILQEIAMRKGPFYIGGTPLPCKEIIEKVKNPGSHYFRPVVDTNTLSEDICNLMQKCWHEDHNERPDFNLTRRIIERFNRENPGNLVENLLQRMEQYAINLEGLVEERTELYMKEKEKADELLYQMLPVPVVNQLKKGKSVPAEAFESVTICFTDIVGFTSLSATSSPMQIVNLLNDLYTCFDDIIDSFNVYKVETIGDAYMLVSGLPVRNGIEHAREIARTALALREAVSTFKIRHRPGEQLKLRIGIHTGPCCAGVVGLKMPRYCLFGDTVNTASRMESSGIPLSIHVSDSTKQLLDKHQCFRLELRGEVPVKGKGNMTTYWLIEETPPDEVSLDGSETRV